MPSEGPLPRPLPEARASCEKALLDHALFLSPSGDKDGRENGKYQPLSSPSCRCYSFGIGPNVCHRLVKGLAMVSKGSAEFLVEGERLQPKVGARTPVALVLEPQRPRLVIHKSVVKLGFHPKSELSTLHPSENQRGGSHKAGSSRSWYRILDPLVSSHWATYSIHQLGRSGAPGGSLHFVGLRLGSFVAMFLMVTTGGSEGSKGSRNQGD